VYTVWFVINQVGTLRAIGTHTQRASWAREMSTQRLTKKTLKLKWTCSAAIYLHTKCNKTARVGTQWKLFREF